MPNAGMDASMGVSGSAAMGGSVGVGVGGSGDVQHRRIYGSTGHTLLAFKHVRIGRSQVMLVVEGDDSGYYDVVFLRSQNNPEEHGGQAGRDNKGQSGQGKDKGHMDSGYGNGQTHSGQGNTGQNYSVGAKGEAELGQGARGLGESGNGLKEAWVSNEWSEELREQFTEIPVRALADADILFLPTGDAQVLCLCGIEEFRYLFEFSIQETTQSSKPSASTNFDANANTNSTSNSYATSNTSAKSTAKRSAFRLPTGPTNTAALQSPDGANRAVRETGCAKRSGCAMSATTSTGVLKLCATRRWLPNDRQFRGMCVLFHRWPRVICSSRVTRVTRAATTRAPLRRLAVGRTFLLHLSTARCTRFLVNLCSIQVTSHC